MGTRFCLGTAGAAPESSHGAAISGAAAIPVKNSRRFMRALYIREGFWQSVSKDLDPHYDRVMTVPAYALARTIAPCVMKYMARHPAAEGVDATPTVEEVEAMVDAAFWASLQQEEGRSPKISLAFVPADVASTRLNLDPPIPLGPRSLGKLAPAVERPGVHLGIRREDDGLVVWGALRTIPPYCLVIEVVSPGLIVIKHSRGEEVGKFANIAVLEGDRVKVLDQGAASRPGVPRLLKTMLELDAFPSTTGPGDVLVRIAIAMRSHGHGGALLVVPSGTESWRSSVVWPIRYPVQPAFTRLRDLMNVPDEERQFRRWHDSLRGTIEGIAGLTAVDGATVITDRYEVIAFGVMIGRRNHEDQIDRVLVSEPVENDSPRAVSPPEVGGTRHQSAAQFVRDQPDSVALVASEDGRFSLFAWSEDQSLVHVHRIDALLL